MSARLAPSRRSPLPPKTGRCVGILQMVKLLLNKGANLSAMDKKERQPIHCAAYLGIGTSSVCSPFAPRRRRAAVADVDVCSLPPCAVPQGTPTS